MLKLCRAPDAITHQMVGMESTSRYGDPGRRLVPTACASTMPRCGSRIDEGRNGAHDARDGRNVKRVSPSPVLQDPSAGAVGETEPDR